LKLLLPDEAVVIITRLRGVFNPDEQVIGWSAAFNYPQAKLCARPDSNHRFTEAGWLVPRPLAAKVIHR
jgi:hypothetical protein